MALPAGRLWNDTRALAQATYPQLSPPDGYQYAGIRRLNDPTQQRQAINARTARQGTILSIAQETEGDLQGRKAYRKDAGSEGRL